MAKTNKRRLTKSERNGRIEKTVSFICLAVLALIWAFPLVYMVGTSFKSELDLQLHPDSLFPSSPSEWTLKHYAGFFVGEDGAEESGSHDQVVISCFHAWDGFVDRGKDKS